VGLVRPRKAVKRPSNRKLLVDVVTPEISRISEAEYMAGRDPLETPFRTLKYIKFLKSDVEWPKIYMSIMPLSPPNFNAFRSADA
jgi:hypothetical protein